ncbi:hypothetical protein AX15_004986 [Amanita polypyramis BW_CC]|nr:hypothetical protein AX15_004986 [Amanita polypyramis BW_CC]
MSLVSLSMSSLLPLFISLVAFSLFKLASFLYRSPLRYLPGPKSSSWIYGNLREIWENDNSVVHEKWVSVYGPTLRYNGPLGMTRLFTVDTKALAHIIMNGSIYQKTDVARYALGQLLGEGLLVAEGDKHKQQRRVMNPAFGMSQIRELTETFVEKAIELRDVWAAEATKQEVTPINVLPWLSRMTLDVIGLAGFNYRFNAISSDSEPNELHEAFATLFKTEARLPLLPLIKGFFPALRFLKTERDAEVKKAKETMTRIGRELLKSSKAAVLAVKKSSVIGKDTWGGRDLLSLLVKANIATDLPDNQRMSDDDVIAQVPTFLVAGHETTSIATTWALFALTQHHRVQEKLRQELLTVSTDNPTMDELNALPYLDAVVRETLRVHAPVPSSMRVATQDDTIPLEKPIRDKEGNLREYISVNKGQTIFIPIQAINRAENIWGEDAREFKPERWEIVPQAASSVPGVWGNLLTFLGGPHACIGYRFSIVEMKAILFTLLRAFEFELAVPPDEVKMKTSIVQRPVLASDPDGKNQMPLLIRIHQRL